MTQLYKWISTLKLLSLFIIIDKHPKYPSNVHWNDFKQEHYHYAGVITVRKFLPCFSFAYHLFSQLRLIPSSSSRSSSTCIRSRVQVNDKAHKKNSWMLIRCVCRVFFLVRCTTTTTTHFSFIYKVHILYTIKKNSPTHSYFKHIYKKTWKWFLVASRVSNARGQIQQANGPIAKWVKW